MQGACGNASYQWNIDFQWRQLHSHHWIEPCQANRHLCYGRSIVEREPQSSATSLLHSHTYSSHITLISHREIWVLSGWTLLALLFTPHLGQSTTGTSTFVGAPPCLLHPSITVRSSLQPPLAHLFRPDCLAVYLSFQLSSTPQP